MAEEAAETWLAFQRKPRTGADKRRRANSTREAKSNETSDEQTMGTIR